LSTASCDLRLPAIIRSVSGEQRSRCGAVWRALEPGRDRGIYASQSRALAALEILVHFDVVPHDFVLTEIEIPEQISILRIEDSELPLGWERDQEIGAKWAAEARFAVLSVPSSIVPADRNFVINPKHREFEEIRFAPAIPFKFDSRLK